MKAISLFGYNRSQRRGIFLLLLLLLLYLYSHIGFSFLMVAENADRKNDYRFEEGYQAGKLKIYPFNPNGLTDFRGYLIGMTPEQIDRVIEFRKSGAFINSPSMFQQISKVPDSQLEEMTPYLKFPVLYKSIKKTSPEKIIKEDINIASAKALQKVYGIGEKLAARIVKYRKYLGGYFYKEQLNEVYGLNDGVVAEVWKSFDIKELPSIEKINVNTASVYQLNRLPYIDREIAQKIVSYRTEHTKIDSIEELKKIANFPTDKLNRIQLYLTSD